MKTHFKYLFILSGDIASGKTTFAEAYANQFNHPLLIWNKSPEIIREDFATSEELIQGVKDALMKDSCNGVLLEDSKNRVSFTAWREVAKECKAQIGYIEISPYYLQLQKEEETKACLARIKDEIALVLTAGGENAEKIRQWWEENKHK